MSYASASFKAWTEVLKPLCHRLTVPLEIRTNLIGTGTKWGDNAAGTWISQDFAARSLWSSQQSFYFFSLTRFWFPFLSRMPMFQSTPSNTASFVCPVFGQWLSLMQPRGSCALSSLDLCQWWPRSLQLSFKLSLATSSLFNFNGV